MSEDHSTHKSTDHHSEMKSKKLKEAKIHSNMNHNSANPGDMKSDHKDHSDHQSKEDHGDHGNQENHHEMMVKDFRQRFIISVLLSLPVLILSPLIQEFLGYTIEFSGVEYVLLAFSVVIYIYGGWPFFKGLREEIEQRQPGMMTLVALAISVSFIYSGAVVLFLTEGKFFFWELVTLIDIMLLGHWIEMRSVLGASRALKELAKLIPAEAHRITGNNGEIEDIPTEQLQAGDVVLIKPGEKVPVDGTIIKGETSVNEAAITGESRPISKSEDDEVIGGSVNGEGSVRVRVEKTGKDTYLQQVMNLVEEAQQTRSRAQDLANRAAFYLTIIAISAGLITFFGWIAVGGSTLFALERMVTVMVITCPHALGLAVPLVVSVSTSLSAKNGVLVRDRQSFERSRNIDKIIFDKTGTLTTGNFGVSEILTFGQLSHEEVLEITASLETESEHSLATAIVKYAREEKDMELREIDNFSSIPGKGIEGTVDGTSYKVVSPAYLEENKLTYNHNKVEPLHEAGKTVVFLLQDDVVLGALALSDIIREDSKQTISRLKELGIEPIMLTGDNEKVASYVAKELGISTYYAEVLPDEKADVVKKVKSDGSIVAMVGDGVNDAPALVTADIGYPIGSGTDVAIESADIILVKDNPLDILNAIKLSKNTYKKMQQNLAWATGYNAIALPLAAGVLYKLGILLSPAVGAALMSLSTVIVAINARFLKLN